MSFMLLLWVLSTTWDLGYGYGYGLTSFYGGFVLCIFFFILSFVIDEPIIIIINLYAPSPFEVWGAARYLANGEKPSMDKPHAA